MKLTSHAVLAALALAAAQGLTPTPAMARQAADPRIDPLEARVQALESELQQYRQRAAATPAIAPTTAPTSSAADVDAVVRKVMTDADARSATLGRAGYSNGFFLADHGNDFQLKLSLGLQPRYIYNHADTATAGGDEDEAGFQMRRAELYLNGNAFGQKAFFQFGGGFQNGTGNFTVVTAYGAYQFDKAFELRGGIFKPPFLIEELTSAYKQQAVDRSFVNAYFTAGTSDGLQAQYSKDDYRVAAMVHDGTNAQDTEFSGDRTDFAVAARGEWRLAGDWSQFADFDGWRDSKFAARLGAAVDYEAAETGDSTDEPNFVKYALDLTVKRAGWNVLLIGVGKSAQSTATTDSFNQYGLLAQAGVFVVPNRVELYGRYEHLFFDGVFNATTPAIEDHVNMVTVGANWFFIGHNAKLTSDVIYVFDELPAGSSGLGILASDDGPQFVFRTGLSLLF